MFLSANAVPLSGWGRYPVHQCPLKQIDSPQELQRPFGDDASLIARGNGRSYGDASLSRTLTLETLRLNRLKHFDAHTGIIECEAGLLLSELLDFLIPQGWFIPVTPGTQFVTVGGAVAADVHGKSHHRAGAFCAHVLELDLAVGDGTILRCSPGQHEELFWATCGGMGLTGVIAGVRFKAMAIPSTQILQTTRRAHNLEDAIAQLDQAHASMYSVAWIDCLATGDSLGRSVVMLGEHAQVEDASSSWACRQWHRPASRGKALPFDFPNFALNGLTVRLFNSIYYRAQTEGQRPVSLTSFFYPLDAILHWNRMYGSRGFTQYQCALPTATGPAALRLLLQEIADTGIGSFLAVLKKLGPQGSGHLSFPMPGYTLALDFPIMPQTFDLLSRLDRTVQSAGGRLYLAKDARASSAMIESGYPRLGEFRDLRRRYGLDRIFRSVLSERLGI
jgi:FAD/FMN-containing dehydrogenase